MQAYLDSHLREVVRVTQGGGDVETELFTVLDGGVPKPDAHGSSLHRKQKMMMLFLQRAAQTLNVLVFSITTQCYSCAVMFRRSLQL